MTRDLINKIDSASLPGCLADDLHQLVDTVAAIRSLHPENLHYQIDFAQRSILDGLLEPRALEAHWMPINRNTVSGAS